MPSVGKLLGVDFGTKRVGIAISDESASVAFPHAIFPNDSSLMGKMGALIKKEGVTGIVIGESKDKDGNENSIMKKVRAFITELRDESSVAVHYEPEFYSSIEARQGGDSGFVDAKAAAIILNSFIERSHSLK
jgi:putative Holliday junction resolvase